MAMEVLCMTFGQVHEVRKQKFTPFGDVPCPKYLRCQQNGGEDTLSRLSKKDEASWALKYKQN